MGSVSVASAYPQPGSVAGATAIHDPAMVIRPSAPRYAAFGSQNTTILSNDRVSFAAGGPYFPVPPGWWQPYEEGVAIDVWAPDVSLHNGQYWMYYSVSKFGSQRSAIGLATSPSGLPGTWTDRGRVIESTWGDDFNAIDPNLLVDSSGNWWLSHGDVAGPGGQSVYRDDFDDKDLLVYHYYDTRLGGQSFLGINWLGWDAQGFPYVY